MKVRHFYVVAALILTACNGAVNFTSNPVHTKDLPIPPCGNGETSCPVPPVTGTESYTVPLGAGKADILFIMDGTPVSVLTNSQIANRLSGFTDALLGIDWQIAIANGGLNPNDASRFTSGELLPLSPNLNMPDPTPLTVINSGISDLLLGNLNYHYQNWPNTSGDYCDQQPYCSYGPNEPMHSLETLFSNRSQQNQNGFFRAGAMLVPIIITGGDENNGQPKVQSSDVIGAFQQTFGSTMAGMKAYSIVVQPNDSSCLKQYSNILEMGSGGQYGTTLSQFAQATGGKSISICQSDYVSALSDIPKGLAPSVTTLTLQQTPLPGTVQITSVPAANLSYSIAGNVVTFAQPLPAGAKLSITYIYEPAP